MQFRLRKNNLLLISTWGVLLLLITAWIAYGLLGHALIEAIYNSETVGIMGSIMAGRAVTPLDDYYFAADRMMLIGSIWVVAGFFLPVAFIKQPLGMILASASVLVCSLIAEPFLRYFVPVPDPYEAVKTLRNINRYIKSEFPRNYWAQTEPEEGLLGIKGPNSFSTNNMGFRGDYLLEPKPASEFRIFMIGGSTTEGLYLDDSQTITKILQDELGQYLDDHVQVKVQNAGKSGDSLPDHLSMLVHRIVHLQPDLIVLFSGVNDLTRFHLQI